MVRLDTKEEKSTYQQLDLFAAITTGKQTMDQCPKSGTGRVPDLSLGGINNDTGTVPQLRHPIKPNNKQINGVAKTPTQKNLDINNQAAKKYSDGVEPNAVHLPRLKEVEEFFVKNNYSTKEAQKFFYYNQGKNWMLTEKLPVTDWKALASKWMLNAKQSFVPKKESDVDLQYLYESFCEGKNITRYILSEHAAKLQLTITPDLWKEATLRRINQLAGSNEQSESRLWLAYTGTTQDPALLQKDEPNLQLLACRLAVLQHFQHLKDQNNTCIH
jgi:hypothetical protein